MPSKDYSFVNGSSDASITHAMSSDVPDYQSKQSGSGPRWTGAQACLSLARRLLAGHIIQMMDASLESDQAASYVDERGIQVNIGHAIPGIIFVILWIAKAGVDELAGFPEG